MNENIYTIPVNDIFREAKGCPICAMRDLLETRCIDYIMGAAMMEPDIRVETNKLGFCKEHFDMMQKGKNVLSLALMLNTHLDEVINDIFPDKKPLIPINFEKSAKKARERIKSCYVCDKIEWAMSRMLHTVVTQFESDSDFRELFRNSSHLCLNHYADLIEVGMKKGSRKKNEEFFTACYNLAKDYAKNVNGNILEFTKLFDYRSDKSSENTQVIKKSPKLGIGFLTSREEKE